MLHYERNKIMYCKIVTDSSADLLNLSGVPFEVAPLKIITDGAEYVDNEYLNVYRMAGELSVYKGKSSTSCPNESDWLNAFGDAENIFCVTITGTLSGSYNAALLAKATYEELHNDRRVFVINSLSAGPELVLIIEKIKELILNGNDFDEISKEITEYTQKTGLLFMLESMRNLSNNGRVSPIVAKMAGLLGIRVVGKASKNGDLEPLNKCRGEENAINTIVEHLKKEGHKKGRVVISHCFNEYAAKLLKSKLLIENPMVNVEIKECRGLCSYYAEKGGMLIGFEKF